MTDEDLLLAMKRTLQRNDPLTLRKLGCDPVDRLTSEQSAYIAGILDGEGCISIRKYASGQYTSIIVIRNTSSALMDYLVNTIPYGKATYHLVKQYLPNCKPVYGLRINGTSAYWLLQDCLPFLVVKREHALIFIGAYEASEEAKANKQPMDTVRFEAFNKLKVINKRGLQ